MPFFDTPLAQTINRIKADPNYTDNPNPIVKRTNHDYIIITPFLGENNIFFKVKKRIRHELPPIGEYDDSYIEELERYLQINNNGNINILDKDFNQKNEPITDYLFSQEAFNLKDKWLATGDFKEHERDFDDVFILESSTYEEKIKGSQMDIMLFIDAKAETFIKVITTYPNAYGGISSKAISCGMPRDKIDSINFNYLALVTYFLERGIEEAEAAKHERDATRNTPA